MRMRRLSLRAKIILLATLPMALCASVTAYLLHTQSNTLLATQITAIEEHMMRAKRQELINYMDLALTSIGPAYSTEIGDEVVAKGYVQDVLGRMTFGDDGYFFVYDQDGVNLVHPKQPFRIGASWIDLRDPNGDYVIRNLIAAAQDGGGFHTYQWEQPSTGAVADKIGYAVALERWGWMIGTGLYVDDIQAQLDLVRSQVADGIDDAFLLIAALTTSAVGVVAAAALMMTLQEHRAANAQLRALTKRVIETQEEERGRVARELHDGISQILAAAQFTLEKGRLAQPDRRDATTDALSQGVARVGLAIREVRRISRALRPSQLDDLGLSEALKSLVEEFGARTGLRVTVRASAVRDALSTDAKTALYRVAQEALTNIERHAEARRVDVSVTAERDAVTLRIFDDGVGLSGKEQLERGLGLRNMRERMDQIGGSLRLRDRTQVSGVGVEIVARVPRAHVPTLLSQRHEKEAEHA